MDSAKSKLINFMKENATEMLKTPDDIARLNPEGLKEVLQKDCAGLRSVAEVTSAATQWLEQFCKLFVLHTGI